MSAETERQLLNFIYIVIFVHCAVGKVVDWGYQYGVHPDNWMNLYPNCGGKRQSPVDIHTRNAFYNKSLEFFQLSGIDKVDGVWMMFKNNGHTVEVDLSGLKLAVTGGGLPGTYVVEQFHFHWGSNNRQGSEHLINGRSKPMEMHIVMYSSRFVNVKAAMNSTDGLAVLAFMVDVGDYNEEFESIIRNVRRIRHKDDKVLLETVSMANLIPPVKYFYRYYGSLTTPPCYENVIWTMFMTPIYLSQTQLNHFRSLGNSHFKGSANLLNNYRRPQPMYNRNITTNYGFIQD